MTQVPQTPPPFRGPVDDAGDGQVVPERRARQGMRNRQMVFVLAISTILAAVILTLLWGAFAGPLHRVNRTTRPPTAQGFQRPALNPPMPGPNQVVTPLKNGEPRTPSP
jgi:hypothetical protein